VIVKGGQIIGEGFHDHAGGPHAEIVALNYATESPNGACAYVTLEPCNHTGRTPPCSLALIAAGVGRVVYAMPDPNPRAGGGAETIRNAGVEVEAGMLSREASEVNRFFHYAHSHQSVYVVAKIATSINGVMASGTSERWHFTGELAQLQGRLLRAECGSVLVGRKTIEVDHPFLTVRDARVVNEPLRVILDPADQLSEDLFPDGRFLVAVAKESAKKNRLLIEAEQGQLNLAALCHELFRRGQISVLVEGGPNTIQSFLEAGLVQEFHHFQSQIVRDSGEKWGTEVHEAILRDLYEVRSQQDVGADSWLTYRLKS
jgi:diaminohydroxyphosphoribosylaminopyrimidine deaminase/5-amino-6-(5-phosphoribosylamino)uracil reductase